MCTTLCTNFDVYYDLIIIQQAERILKKAQKTHKQRVEVHTCYSHSATNRCDPCLQAPNIVDSKQHYTLLNLAPCGDDPGTCTQEYVYV